MGLKTLMQAPTAPNNPNFSDKILPVNKIGDTGGTWGEGIFAGQPVNPGGIPRPPSFNNTAIGPGHPDYQEGRQIQLPPGQTPGKTMIPEQTPMEPPEYFGGFGVGIGGPRPPNISPMPIRPPNVGGDVGNIKRDDSADYSNQFSGFGDQLGGFGKQLTGFGDQLGGLGNQMTGYQDALGGFNEQVGGFGKQFENLNTRLDSMEKGIASLGEQFQPQQQQQQQNPYANFYSNSNPFGSSMYGGLGSMMRYF